MDKLRKIQMIESDLLRELDRVCSENNASYIMAYGTMLGAVRHNGFIPWDDDLDVCMMYSDIVKIKNKFKDDCFFQSKETDPQMPFPFFKLRNKSTRMVQPEFEHLNMCQGVWVDIFPCFNSANNNRLRKLQYNLSLIYQAMVCRELNISRNKKKTFSFLPAKFVRVCEQIVLKTIDKLGSKKSDDVFVIVNTTFAKSFFNKDYLIKTAHYKFEGFDLTGPKDYHSYLSGIYGDDYMTPKKWSHLSNYDDVVC